MATVAAALLIAAPAAAAPAGDVRGALTTRRVDPAAVERARAAVVARGDVQTRLPVVKQHSPRRSSWFTSLLLKLGEWVGPLLRPLLWLVGIAAVFGVLYLTVPGLRDAVQRWLRRRPVGRADVVVPFSEAQARDLLAEADALAAAGRFGEAAQLLMTRSVEEIARLRPGELAPADTARAIAAWPNLPPRPRAAFATLARVVETARWARRAVGADDWQQARSAWHDVADRRGWREAAHA